MVISCEDLGTLRALHACLPSLSHCTHVQPCGQRHSMARHTCSFSQRKTERTQHQQQDDKRSSSTASVTFQPVAMDAAEPLAGRASVHCSMHTYRVMSCSPHLAFCAVNEEEIHIQTHAHGPAPPQILVRRSRLSPACLSCFAVHTQTRNVRMPHLSRTCASASVL